MNTERANTKLFMEYLKAYEITNEYFKITVKRVHTTSGTMVFKRKDGGQVFRAKFIILIINSQGRIDILVVILKNKFSFIKDGVKQSSNFITSEVQYFQNTVHTLVDII